MTIEEIRNSTELYLEVDDVAGNQVHKVVPVVLDDDFQIFLEGAAWVFQRRQDAHHVALGIGELSLESHREVVLGDAQTFGGLIVEDASFFEHGLDLFAGVCCLCHFYLSVVK